MSPNFVICRMAFLTFRPRKSSKLVITENVKPLWKLRYLSAFDFTFGSFLKYNESVSVSNKTSFIQFSVPKEIGTIERDSLYFVDILLGQAFVEVFGKLDYRIYLIQFSFRFDHQSHLLAFDDSV